MYRPIARHRHAGWPCKARQSAKIRHPTSYITPSRLAWSIRKCRLALQTIALCSNHRGKSALNSRGRPFCDCVVQRKSPRSVNRGGFDVQVDGKAACWTIQAGPARRLPLHPCVVAAPGGIRSSPVGIRGVTTRSARLVLRWRSGPRIRQTLTHGAADRTWVGFVWIHFRRSDTDTYLEHVERIKRLVLAIRWQDNGMAAALQHRTRDHQVVGQPKTFDRQPGKGIGNGGGCAARRKRRCSSNRKPAGRAQGTSRPRPACRHPPTGRGTG